MVPDEFSMQEDLDKDESSEELERDESRLRPSTSVKRSPAENSGSLSTLLQKRLSMIGM